MKLTFKDGLEISKVIVKAVGWVNKTCKLGVNGADQVTISSFTDELKPNQEAAFLTYEFDLATPANEITFETTLCVMISEMQILGANNA